MGHCSASLLTFISNIIVDESHHLCEGGRYAAVLRHFDRAHVTLFSATPERADGRHRMDYLPLEWGFYMSKQFAWENGIIKRPVFVEPYCNALQLQTPGMQPELAERQVLPDGTAEWRIAARPEAGNLLQKRWFNVLCRQSPDIRKDTLLTVLRLLTRQRLLSGTKHMAVIKAASVDEAVLIREALGRIRWRLGQAVAVGVDGPGMGPVANAEVVIGDMRRLYPHMSERQADQEKQAVLDRAARGLVDVLIIVEMLKEGWSNLLVSVVNFQDPVESTISAEQIGGRGGRILVAPDDPGDQAHPGHVAMAAGAFFGQQWQADWAIDPGNPPQVQAGEQTCYIVAHETLNMGPVLRKSGIINNEEDMQVAVPGRDGVQGQPGARGLRGGDAVLDGNREQLPVLVIKAGADIGFELRSLAGSVPNAADTGAVTVAGQTPLAQINRDTQHIAAALPPALPAANNAWGPLGAAMVHLQQLIQQAQAAGAPPPAGGAPPPPAAPAAAAANAP